MELDCHKSNHLWLDLGLLLCEVGKEGKHAMVLECLVSVHVYEICSIKVALKKEISEAPFLN